MAPPVHKAIRDPEAFLKAVELYIAKCTLDDTGKPLDKPDLITLEGLGLATGVYNGQRWSEWAEKYSKPDWVGKPQALISEAIKKVKLASQCQLQQSCFKGKSSMALALLKCMHGYCEAQHAIKHEVSGSINISVATGVPKAAE